LIAGVAPGLAMSGDGVGDGGARRGARGRFRTPVWWHRGWVGRSLGRLGTFLLLLLALANGAGPVRALLEKLGPFLTGPGPSLLAPAANVVFLLGVQSEAVGSVALRTL
jgi:hypothetical protein